MTIGKGKNRVWAPEVGSLCKLKERNDYASRQLTMWAWLQVQSIDEVSLTVTVQHSNAGNLEGESFKVPLDRIQAPIGWEPIVKIYADPENIQKIRDWKDVGVNVWMSEDLSCAGRMSYTKGDAVGKPHWSMGLIEHIPPSDMKDRIELIEVITEDCGKPDKKTRKQGDAEGWKYTYCRHTFTWSRSKEIPVPW